jgi:type IV secretory pathway VirB2 component (pilin)
MQFSLSTGNCGIADAICTVVDWFTGSLGTAIASLSVIFLGIQAFFGKITWGTVVLYTVGIFSIFGAGDIVEAFTGVSADVCGGGVSIGFSF